MISFEGSLPGKCAFIGRDIEIRTFVLPNIGISVKLGNCIWFGLFFRGAWLLPLDLSADFQSAELSSVRVLFFLNLTQSSIFGMI